VQPVELAKLALIFLSAHVLARRLDWDGEPSWLERLKLWWQFLLPLLVFVALVLMALLLAHDFSPLMLLAAWLIGLALAWSLASGRILAFVLAVGLLVGGATSIWVAHEHGAEWLSRIGLYSDRMEVWVNPGLHPHNGEQFRRGLELAGEGEVYGTEAVHPWRVPEVQNDFAPDYFLSRFGAIGGAALLGLQMFYLGCLLTLGWMYLPVREGDCRAMLFGRLRFFALWGGAFMLAGHFAVSWGTNLGWLPVMGQPMPFISAAGSMLAFFLFPLQLLYVSNPTIEEEN
jgi:cell division protein FtsW